MFSLTVMRSLSLWHFCALCMLSRPVTWGEMPQGGNECHVLRFIEANRSPGSNDPGKELGTAATDKSD